jgi:hypothetical protein
MGGMGEFMISLVSSDSSATIVWWKLSVSCVNGLAVEGGWTVVGLEAARAAIEESDWWDKRRIAGETIVVPAETPSGSWTVDWEWEVKADGAGDLR